MKKNMNQLHLNTSSNFHNINEYYHRKKNSCMNSYINDSNFNTISETQSKYSKLRISAPIQVLKSNNITTKLEKKTIENNTSSSSRSKKKLINFNNNSIYYSKHKNKTSFIKSYLTSDIKLSEEKKVKMNKIRNKNRVVLTNNNMTLNDENKENKANNYQHKNRNICITHHFNTGIKQILFNDNKMSTLKNKTKCTIKKLLDLNNNNSHTFLKKKIIENSKINNSTEQDKYKAIKNNHPPVCNISYLFINNLYKKDNKSKNKETFPLPKKQLSNYISPKKLFLQNEKSEKKEKKSTKVAFSRNLANECENKRRISQIINYIPKIINPNEFNIIKQIGSGSFGKIYKTIWNQNNEKYAMKIVYTKSKDNILYIQEKVNLIKSFEEKTKCEGLIKIYGDTYIKKGNDYHYYEIMELAERDWEQEIKIRKSNLLHYTEYELLNIMSQLIKTLSLLQSNNITHRDIKLQNILLLNGKYKICDFGEARKLMQKGVIMQPARGSELYMSPIQFFGLNQNIKQVQHNTYKSDVFSLGMCILFAATLSDDCLYDIRELTDMNIISNILERYLRERYSMGFIRLLLCLLEINEKKRPDFIILDNIISQIKISE